jgi:hypothetical protein
MTSSSFPKRYPAGFWLLVIAASAAWRSWGTVPAATDATDALAAALGGDALSASPAIHVVDKFVSEKLTQRLIDALPPRETWQPCELEEDVEGKTCTHLVVTPEVVPLLEALASVTSASTFADWTHVPVVRLAPGKAGTKASAAHTDCMGYDKHGQPLTHDLSVVLYLTPGPAVHFPSAKVTVPAEAGRLLAFDPTAMHYVDAMAADADAERLTIQIPLTRRETAFGVAIEAMPRPFMMLLQAAKFISAGMTAMALAETGEALVAIMSPAETQNNVSILLNFKLIFFLVLIYIPILVVLIFFLWDMTKYIPEDKDKDKDKI